MSLVPVTVSIERDTETDDAYGGVTVTTATVYSGLQAWVNFSNPRPADRSESVTTQGAMAGPGVMTRVRQFCKFEPYPAITVQVNDRLVVSGGHTYLVVGIRPYEYTLQLDLEFIS